MNHHAGRGPPRSHKNSPDSDKARASRFYHTAQDMVRDGNLGGTTLAVADEQPIAAHLVVTHNGGPRPAKPIVALHVPPTDFALSGGALMMALALRGHGLNRFVRSDCETRPSGSVDRGAIDDVAVMTASGPGQSQIPPGRTTRRQGSHRSSIRHVYRQINGLSSDAGAWTKIPPEHRPRRQAHLRRIPGLSASGRPGCASANNYRRGGEPDYRAPAGAPVRSIAGRVRHLMLLRRDMMAMRGVSLQCRGGNLSYQNRDHPPNLPSLQDQSPDPFNNDGYWLSYRLTWLVDLFYHGKLLMGRGVSILNLVVYRWKRSNRSLVAGLKAKRKMLTGYASLFIADGHCLPRCVIVTQHRHIPISGTESRAEVGPAATLTFRASE
jgi:hypothetical protein